MNFISSMKDFAVSSAGVVSGFATEATIKAGAQALKTGISAGNDALNTISEQSGNIAFASAKVRSAVVTGKALVNNDFSGYVIGQATEVLPTFSIGVVETFTSGTLEDQAKLERQFSRLLTLTAKVAPVVWKGTVVAAPYIWHATKYLVCSSLGIKSKTAALLMGAAQMGYKYLSTRKPVPDPNQLRLTDASVTVEDVSDTTSGNSTGPVITEVLDDDADDVFVDSLLRDIEEDAGEEDNANKAANRSLRREEIKKMLADPEFLQQVVSLVQDHKQEEHQKMYGDPFKVICKDLLRVVNGTRLA